MHAEFPVDGAAVLTGLVFPGSDLSSQSGKVTKLRTNDAAAAWTVLWNELHHQGDVDTESYAAVPELVTIYQSRAVLDWNAYALIGTIELERGRCANPDLPPWLASRYHEALARLGDLAGGRTLSTI